MEKTYLLWSARSSAWLSAGGTYVSDRKQALVVGEAQMLDMCKVHYKNGFSEFGLLPVSINTLNQIKG